MNKDELVKIYVDKQKAINELAKQAYLSNLFAFNQDILHVEEGGEGSGKRLPLKDFHQQLCEFIERNPTRKKIALMPRGHLKALKTEGTKILTPNGFRNYSELKIGDEVISENGVTKIVQVHPKSEMELYKVTTNDGREIICNKEHLFKIRIKQNSKKWVIKPLKELINKYSSGMCLLFKTLICLNKTNKPLVPYKYLPLCLLHLNSL